MTGRQPAGLRFGYGTNGFAHHRLDEALSVLADLGYQGVALTLDHPHLDPFGPDLASTVTAARRRVDALGLAVVVETGGRYVLDPWGKHQPSLLSDAGRDRRVDLLQRAVRIGAGLGAEAVSFWSGSGPDGLAEKVAWHRLAEGCAAVLTTAEAEGVTLGFEPEPGMFVDTIAGYRRLRSLLGEPAAFGLTLDIGHCRCNEDSSVPDCVRQAAPYLVNVQIDDMRRGVHEHLEFGQGEIDFPPVLAALAGSGYRGLVAVELPRHSHAAPSVARQSLAFLRRAASSAGSSPAGNGMQAVTGTGRGSWQ
jgi:L-ribulose-5-phosphate 3-epimerase